MDLDPEFTDMTFLLAPAFGESTSQRRRAHLALVATASDVIKAAARFARRRGGSDEFTYDLTEWSADVAGTVIDLIYGKEIRDDHHLKFDAWIEMIRLAHQINLKYLPAIIKCYVPEMDYEETLKTAKLLSLPEMVTKLPHPICVCAATMKSIATADVKWYLDTLERKISMREAVLTGAIASRETVEEQRELVMLIPKWVSSNAAANIGTAIKDPALKHLLDILRCNIDQRE